MPMSEAYDALARGVAQGIIGPYEPMKGFRLAEVVDNSTEYGSAYVGSNYVVMNKDKWNSIPANAQKIIEQVNDEWIEKMGKLWDELDKEGKDVFLQKGGKAVVLSKEENVRWSAKLRPIFDEYVTNMKAKGLPADTLSHTEKGDPFLPKYLVEAEDLGLAPLPPVPVLPPTGK